MATYTVHEPPVADADRVDRGVELEFVKDGFSWLTAICPPLGFIANSLWLPAIAYLVGATLLAYMLHALKADPAWISLIFLAINVYLGFEVSSLKRWMLDHKGWQTVGVVNGKTMAECERRFFESWLPGQPVIASEPAKGAGTASSTMRRTTFWPFGAG